MMRHWILLGTKNFTRNNLLRTAAAIPDDGLAFDEVDVFSSQMNFHWRGTDRAALRACVEQGLLRFKDGRYFRPRFIYVMPKPPSKLPMDKHDPQWPEIRFKRLTLS